MQDVVYMKRDSKKIVDRLNQLENRTETGLIRYLNRKICEPVGPKQDTFEAGKVSSFVHRLSLNQDISVSELDIIAEIHLIVLCQSFKHRCFNPCVLQRQS